MTLGSGFATAAHRIDVAYFGRNTVEHCGFSLGYPASRFGFVVDNLIVSNVVSTIMDTTQVLGYRSAVSHLFLWWQNFTTEHEHMCCAQENACGEDRNLWRKKMICVCDACGKEQFEYQKQKQMLVAAASVRWFYEYEQILLMVTSATTAMSKRNFDGGGGWPLLLQVRANFGGGGVSPLVLLLQSRANFGGGDVSPLLLL